MKYIVGLTGGIGSGKSAVAALFREHGIQVVDADIAARRVVEPGTPALQAIADHFGEATLLDDGTLDRAALRQIIFDTEDERLWLEQLLHPAIGQWIADELASAESPYAILESPLLLETTQHEMADCSLVVDVEEQTQIDRASARDGNTPEQIKAIISAQMSRELRLTRADDVIDNNASLEALLEPVQALHQKYLQLAAEKAATNAP
ncbi:MAG: dephospho-CoA kinase [Porticoccaceae bacterium]|nr:dephospho-CoA kinase [Porticoccaceae bacterium]